MRTRTRTVMAAVAALAIAALPSAAHAQRRDPDPSDVVARVALEPLAGIGLGFFFGGLLVGAAFEGASACQGADCLALMGGIFTAGYAVGSVLGPVYVNRHYGGRSGYWGSVAGAAVGLGGATAATYYALESGRPAWLLVALAAVPIGAAIGTELESAIRDDAAPDPRRASFVVPVALPVATGDRVTGISVGVGGAF